jgi:hypothetical protein
MAIVFKNVDASPEPFYLSSGQHGIAAHAAVWGSGVMMQLCAPDETTWLDVLTAAIVTDGVSLVTVPAGQFRLVLTGVSGLYLAIDPIS